MKATELIKQLSAFVEKHGDTEVFVYSDYGDKVITKVCEMPNSVVTEENSLNYATFTTYHPDDLRDKTIFNAKDGVLLAP